MSVIDLVLDGLIADGLCAIDIVHKPGATDDGARLSQFLNAAQAILNKRIGKRSGIDGGYVGGIGMCILLRRNILRPDVSSQCRIN